MDDKNDIKGEFSVLNRFFNRIDHLFCIVLRAIG